MVNSARNLRTFLFGVFKQVIGRQQFGDKPIRNVELLIAKGLTIFLTLLFVSLRLDISIKKDRIYVLFFPFSHKVQILQL